MVHKDFDMYQPIHVYCRPVGAIPLSYVNIQRDSSHMYEDIENFTPATDEVGGVPLEQCPAYLPATRQ